MGNKIIYLFYELCSPNTENIDIEVLDTDISNFGTLTNKSKEIHKINKDKPLNYGWAIVSAGEHYSIKDGGKKSGVNNRSRS